MKALVIRSPWIDLILDGKKTWEMRSRGTSIRGTIGLIKAGTGLVLGTADLVDSLPELSAAEMRRTTGLHAIPAAQIDDAVSDRWTTPWVLANVRRYEEPMAYKHPSGAVTWVNLSEATTSGAKPSPAGDWVDITLTDANVRHGHIYLRAAERLLPADCIAGSNKTAIGAPIHVRFLPGKAIDTDVAGDKMIFRARAPVREFFDRTGAKGGETARFTRVTDRSFTLALVR